MDQFIDKIRLVYTSTHMADQAESTAPQLQGAHFSNTAIQ